MPKAFSTFHETKALRINARFVSPERAVAWATEVLDDFPARYRHHWLAGMRRKLGLTGEDRDDFALTTDFLNTMAGQGVGFTQAFRRLADVAEGAHEGGEAGLRALYGNAGALDGWLVRWHTRSASEPATPAQRALAMRAVNPVYIPRNHRVEAALSAAVEHGDFRPFDTLLALLQHRRSLKPKRLGRTGAFAFAHVWPACHSRTDT